MVKNITFIFAFILFGVSLLGQIPQAINYQAIARSMNGEPITNQNILIKISILSDSVSGEAVYSELHETTTNNNGLFSLQLGKPEMVLSGVFEDINWGNSVYFLKLEMDENGGAGFQLMGISQLLSVPYALYSENTAHPEDADADPINEIQTISMQDYQLTLSKGGGTFLTGVKSYTQAEIDLMETYNGLTVHNATTNCINYYFLNNWFEACGNCTPMPSQANAGVDQVFYDNTTSTNLEGNTPVHGIGVWEVLSGQGGSFEDPSNPGSLFTGLLDTLYVLRWEIFTSCDTSFDEVSVVFHTWQCGTIYTDHRDNHQYETVEIGGQCWMSENLAYLSAVSPSSSGSNVSPYYYVYNYQGNDINEAKATEDYQNYGVLYNWVASLNACPNEWHLPSDSEWNLLMDYLGGAAIAGGKMKSTHTAPDPHPRWDSPNTGATNSSYFTGFPGGYRSTAGSFSTFGKFGWWWSSSESSSVNGWDRFLDYSLENATRSSNSKAYGFSVRCLRD